MVGSYSRLRGGDVTWPHLLDGVLVDEVVVVFVETAVQGHAVALEQQVLETQKIRLEHT